MARFLVFICVILLPCLTHAQTVSVFSSSAELGGFVSSSGQVPFWLRANQWGQVPLASPAGTARIGFHYFSHQTFTDSSRNKERPGWEVRTEGVANVGASSKLLLPEAYAKLRWKQWELMAGRERQIVGIVDTTLSSGSYSWSGNALPVPMVRFGLAEYLPFGFLNNFVSIKGSFVHGWFLNSYIQKSYLHQKTLYGRLGKPEGSFHLQVGLVHQVMWGGEADYLVNNPVAINGKLPSTFKDYVRGVVLAQIPEDGRSSRITTFDGINRIGNQLGHFDLALDLRIKRTLFLLYQQHPYEDASGFQFQNLPDGLYGLSIRRNPASVSFLNLKGLVLEYLFTKNQTGDDFTIPGSRFTGADNYFNHSQYIEGWSYRGLGIGTPFIPTKIEVKKGAALNDLYFPTNRIILYHLGLEGMLAQKFKFMVKASYRLHYPSWHTPLSDPVYRQFSSLLSFDVPLLRWGNTRLKAQVAYDKGGVLPESLGGYVALKSELSKK